MVYCRFFFKIRLAAAFLVLATLCPGGNARAGDPAVTDIRLGVHPGKTRVVISGDHKIPLKGFELADPYRVVIDLPEVDWRLDRHRPKGAVGVISGYRFGHFAPGQSRIVFDLRGPAVIDKILYLPPRKERSWRMVVDVVEVSAASFARKQGADTPAVSAPAPRAALFMPAPMPPRRTNFLKVVAIDPGHGGIDPGTLGRGGLKEKNITLAMARQLKKELEKRKRYRVVLTRDRDVFLRLRERVAMARAAGADLFISLHADSLRDPSVRGASVYTLSEKASDREAGELAAQENKSDVIAGVDLSGETPEVTNILIDLAQRETMNHSARLARLLVKEMHKATRFLRKSHRFAGFAVLKAPDVPSVLIEMGYLSNELDRAQLTKPRYRARLARAIADAVDAHFASPEVR